MPKSDWYEYGDKLYIEVVREVERIFRKARLTVKFDEINARKSEQISWKVYKQLIALNRKKYEELCEYVWWLVYEELFGTDYKKHGKIDPKAQSLVDSILRDYNPVTKYSYENETERKRARFFESIVTDGESKNRREFEKDFKTAEGLWKKQTAQYFINVEDTTRLEAYKSAGVKKVKWVTEKDEKVCIECKALDEKVFKIGEVPAKPHPYCRCRVVPVGKWV